MVGLLIVSHSMRLADGVKEFVDQIAHGINVVAAGGREDGGLGTSVERIQEGLRKVESSGGTLVLVDIGGAVLSVETAIEILGKADVLISDAPLVEGAYFAALEAVAGSTLQETAAAALLARALVKVHE